MTIRNLDNHKLMKIKGPWRAATKANHTALSFVFDQGYLHPFKVLIYSLAKTRSLLDVPIIIFSQDPAVTEDPLVNIVADEIRFISKDQISSFSEISSDRINEKYRLDWIPKYTFLKWLIFDNYSDFDRMIFIDSDIVCLKNADSILERECESDLVGGPVFRDTLLKSEKNKLSDNEIFRNLRGMISKEFPLDLLRLNTGVLDIRKKCLSVEFRNSLLELTRRNNFVNEQSYVTKLFESRSDYKLGYFSSKFNYGAGSLSYLPVYKQIQLLKDIVFLHFPGPKKPWKTEVSSEMRFSHMVWKKIENEGIKSTNIFTNESEELEWNEVADNEM